MPSFNVRIDLTDADKEHLATITKYAEDKAKEQWKSQILSDRARAVEQVKRLYAFVMGFAVWSCITNAYLCGRKLQELSPPAWDAYSILIAQVVSFISLIALFYLGAERMLDRKYLQYDSPIPTWNGLCFDLFTLGVTALWFAILANTFPLTSLSFADVKALLAGPTSAPPTPDLRIQIYIYFGYFISFLLILYLLDVFFLVVHGVVLWQESTATRNKGLQKAYVIWILINLLSLTAMYFLARPFVTQADLTPYLLLNVGATIVLLWHVGRFFLDFWWTFDFYYPTNDPEKPPAVAT